MPMAQCQTEGKNHTATGSFELYTGLFATKLHTSNGVTDNLDRFQGGVKYSNNNEVSSNYATGKAAGNGNFVKEDSYNKVSPHVGSCTTFTDNDNFKIRSESGRSNMGKADYGTDGNVTGAANLRSVGHLAPAGGADNFRGISAVHNVAASFQKMGLSGNGPAGGLEKSGYGYSRGFYSKDAAAAETVLALWGRPEVEIPKDDSSCFVGGFSSSGDRSSHSSGELTSSDGHTGSGGKDLDSGSWSGRSSSGKPRGGGSLKTAGSPSGESPNAGSSSGGSTSGGSSIGGSPTVVRTSSSGNLFTNGSSSPYVNGGSPGVASARGTGSSRGSSTEGSPTSSRNPSGLPTSRSLNEVGTSGGFAAQHAYLGRNGSDRTGERSTTSSRYFGDGSSSSFSSRDRGDDSPTLEISSGVSYSRSSSDDGALHAPRKSTSDLPPPTIPASRHVRQPSLGVGYYTAGTSTSKPSSETSPSSGVGSKGGVTASKGSSQTSPGFSGGVPAPRSPSEPSSGGISAGRYPSRTSSDPNPVRHSGEASSHSSRYAGVPAASRSSSDVSSNGSSISGGASSRYSPEPSSTGNIYSAGVPSPRVGKDVSSNGNIYQKVTAPARSGSDVSATTGNIYPGKISQSTSASTIPAGGVPPSRHGSEVGANSNIQSASSAAKPVNGLSANGFCVGGNFCGVAKTPTGVIHNGVASGKSALNALNSGTLNGKSQSGRVLNSGIITGGSFASTKRDVGQTTMRSSPEPVMITKGLSMMDPEELKNLGNDLYKKGQFVEALSLYDKAIVLCPERAPYRSNRAAALTGLGRLAEAERECKEALRLDPSFTRAHQRLGSIFLRLGRVEDSNKHFKCAGQHIERGDIQKIENIDKHLTKCLEAKRSLDWSIVIKESEAAVAAGADFAPQILALKAEALLKLHRLDEADLVLKEAQKMEALIGRTTYTPADTHILVVQAQIGMALGRFEDATKAAEEASHIDPYNLEILTLLKRARAVGNFRYSGNELFKAGRFAEATSAYGEGLQIDPANAVLLCNRAACRLKLGHWEKAVEDCNAALDAQPQYTKALLRRANCYAKLERWEDSRRDFEVVRKRCPADVDVARQLFEVEVELKKMRGEDTYKMKFGGQIGGQVVEISSSEQLQDAIRCPGLAVVHFKKENERCRQLALTLENLCRAYPAVNFIKVDVDVNMSIAVSESINFIPTFKLYKNGLKVQEMLAPSQHVVEQAVKSYCH